MTAKSEKIIAELAKIMKAREVDLDTRCGIVITLKTDAKLLQMHEWINQNPYAGQTEIMRHLYVMMGWKHPLENKVRTHKVAVL